MNHKLNAELELGQSKSAAIGVQADSHAQRAAASASLHLAEQIQVSASAAIDGVNALNTQLGQFELALGKAITSLEGAVTQASGSSTRMAWWTMGAMLLAALVGGVVGAIVTLHFHSS